MTRDEMIERVAQALKEGLFSRYGVKLGEVATVAVDMIAGEVEALQTENARLREAIAYHYARNGTAYDIARDTLYADRAALTDPAAPSPSPESKTETGER